MRGDDLQAVSSSRDNIKQGIARRLRQPARASPSASAWPTSSALILGDTITLISPDGDVTPFGTTPQIKSYPVVAIFDLGMVEFDASHLHADRGGAALFQHGGRAQTIEVFVDHPDDVDALREPVESAAQRQVFISDWQQRNETFFSALQVERVVMFMILSLIILVAALNIISSLIMLVKDKGRDIAILRTMGATRGSIMRIFLMTGAAIGVAGTLPASLLGIVICLNAEAIRQFFSWVSGTMLFSPELFFLSQLPAKIDLGETVVGRADGARPVVPRDALSGLARRPARSGRGAAVRVSATPIIELKSVERHYVQGERKLTILNGADFALRAAARWSRSSRPRAPASRRCCTWPACSSGPTPAT